MEEFAALAQRSQQYTYTACTKSNGNSYEALVDFLNAELKRRPNITNPLISVKDDEEKISYSIRNISDELALHIIEDHSENIKNIRYPFAFISRKIEELPSMDLFSLLNMLFRFPQTVYLEAESSHPDLSVCAKSFLFNIAYNYNYVFKIMNDYDDFIQPRFILQTRRHRNLEELSAPRLVYNEELVEQYYMALLSENAFVRFIGFYHILEHFYEEVYNEEILNGVQNIIRDPGFSSKRKKDILKIVNLIQTKTHHSKEAFQGNELEALELTLKKYIDLAELKNDLEEFEGKSVDYYKNTEVSFSKGDPVDLYDFSNDNIYKKLAARIYKTRNSLVHSKSNEMRIKERGIYNPFKDSQELQKEIPLMRLIAEAIIRKTAKEL